jgi:hypothetical protein
MACASEPSASSTVMVTTIYFDRVGGPAGFKATTRTRSRVRAEKAFVN